MQSQLKVLDDAKADAERRAADASAAADAKDCEVEALRAELADAKQREADAIRPKLDDAERREVEEAKEAIPPTLPKSGIQAFVAEMAREEKTAEPTTFVRVILIPPTLPPVALRIIVPKSELESYPHCDSIEAVCGGYHFEVGNSLLLFGRLAHTEFEVKNSTLAPHFDRLIPIGSFLLLSPDGLLDESITPSNFGDHILLDEPWERKQCERLGIEFDFTASSSSSKFDGLYKLEECCRTPYCHSFSHFLTKMPEIFERSSSRTDAALWQCLSMVRDDEYIRAPMYRLVALLELFRRVCEYPALEHAYHTLVRDFRKQ